MTYPIRIFVGTDERSKLPEEVLEYSIRKNTTADVDITWMRCGDEGWRWNAHGWHTSFTSFRYAIPELCGFEGRAIYLDSDMVVFGDIGELWEMLFIRPWLCLSEKRTDVSVIDCECMGGFKWWPDISTMRESGEPGYTYRKLLIDHCMIETKLPPEWNHLDHYEEGVTKLAHFTEVETQPWRPWPERMAYRAHSDAGLCGVFWDLLEEARHR